MARPAKRNYTDEERGHALFVLHVNGNNARRTARELNIPEGTIRRWRQLAEKGELPETSFAIMHQEADEFVQEAEIVRFEALKLLRTKLPNARPAELNAIIGTLDDKITRARGLPTSRVEHTQELPAPDEVRELLGGLVIDAIAKQASRNAEIGEVIDGEIVEPAALPSSTP